jgi:hypothetical protein
MELEKRLTKIKNELKSMKENARKKEAATKKYEEAKKRKETNKYMVAIWIKDNGGQGCSKDPVK